MAPRIVDLRRILSVYLFPGKSPLAFWYETPELNEAAFQEKLGPYYMRFRGKAEYAGPFDTTGIPLLDYRGQIGRQYNPIAIAQYGLASYNRFRATADVACRAAFLRIADWLVQSLEKNSRGLRVWQHHFDWPYRELLVAPWYSGLAQGQGVSLLVRAAVETGRREYGDAAAAAFVSLTTDVSEGGVLVRDPDGALWIEEYLINPPSHILNGFLWALWGVHDYHLWSGDPRAHEIFHESTATLVRHLGRYDAGYWSLYELPAAGPPMLASPYYHHLHIVQLEVMSRLTDDATFLRYADRWRRFQANPVSRTRAVVRKTWFKLRYY